jgi:hypothetical protein
LLKMRTLISGEAVRASTAKNTTRSTTPTAMLAQMTGLPQPHRADCWSRRLAEAAFVGASVTLEVDTVSPLLSDARQAGPESGTSLLTAAAAAFVLFNGDGDGITAHRLLTQAIEDQATPYRISDTGVFEAVSTLFMMCWLGGRPELKASFHTAIGGFTPDVPQDLYLLGQTNADPVRTAAAVLPEVDAAIASLRSETDQLRILMISTTAHFTDRQPGCREALWRWCTKAGRAAGSLR